MDDELPDIDLAIIDDTSKIILMVELKWFLDPAEVSETIEKSMQLDYGIMQLTRIKELFLSNDRFIFEKLKVDETYSIELVLVSANFTGFGDIQRSDVACIREKHLIEKLNNIDELKQLTDWLVKKSYLPIENVHFEKLDDNLATVGKWDLRWFGYNVKINEIYNPV